MRKFLFWLQERIKSWIKPAMPVLIIDLLSDLTHSRTDPIVEKALLRQRLIILERQVKRPQLSNPDRIRLVLLSHFTKLWTAQQLREATLWGSGPQYLIRDRDKK